MAYNDMDVVIYKMLSYLYECMKEGVLPRQEDFCHNAKLFRVPEKYWLQLIEEMQETGLIKGFFFIDTKDGKIIQMTDKARITIKGGQFLEENSRMKEVKVFLGDSFKTVLSSTVQAIVNGL